MVRHCCVSSVNEANGINWNRVLTLCFVIAVAHRLLSVAFVGLGFAAGMASFTSSNSGGIARLFRLGQALLDFPLVFLFRDQLLRALGNRPTPEFSEVWTRGVLGPIPFGASLLWSLLFGFVVALLIVRFSPRRYDNGRNA